MSIAYVDCFAGASGDMLLGALVDAGVSLDELHQELSGLGLRDWELRAEKVATHGLAATHVQVVASDDKSERRYTELAELLHSSRLRAKVKDQSERILRRLAEVEARLHGTALDEVHLHELGGVDTLIDIVGAVAGFQLLGVSDIYVSALPMGRGAVQTRHGLLPLPAPAVLELARGAPLRPLDLEAELVTPTGAAILTTLARGYMTFPPMTLQRVGYGSGTYALPIANVLRILVGTSAEGQQEQIETLVVLETNIDDMNPQWYDHVFDRLFEHGALDVWLTPIQMKKNRAASMLAALCRPAEADSLVRLLFRETTTLGVRKRETQRQALARELITLETPFGTVTAKVARLDGRVLRATPEYEDCRRLAETNHVPLAQVYQAVESSIRAALSE